MTTFLFPLMILTLSILTAACSKPLKWSKDELYMKAFRADESTSLILPKSISEGVNCADYTAGCLSAHIVRIKGLDLIAIEFNTEEDAIFAAKKLRGYYTRNWLLDDVTKEPILERFVVEHLEAKKP